ncbi:MAG: Dihydropteroate synthase [Parcubacteria group bacterium GW2011_GWC2_44_17]|nr:MAG: Dihydropteroate synthase [Parcubacteria group bacterium GW2011_GWC2_44_17]KKT48333.1 MAG: Dihydropteroate synthase [Parcubacteria group bacterium GW2011_GWF2_44_17]HCA66839.1 dihydropteroate synthase [Candidatus Jacksonbacteria bacterium]HCE86570.1 dihydropteroate synthase [Candidatus Jacksonbacteria bacterium]
MKTATRPLAYRQACAERKNRLMYSRMTKPLIMGVLNVTPDSFSDGGQFMGMEKALARAKEMEREGADIIDIGGESTGPKSKLVGVEEEYSRIIPVVRAIRKRSQIPISIDTYKSDIAEAALKAGANMINDVTALRGDPRMGEIIARYRCQVVLMYAKDKTPRTTLKKKRYADIIQTISEFWKKRIAYARTHGIKKPQIILDPGLGHFVSAVPKYSFEIIARLHELTYLGYQILIGISRKSFLGGEIDSRDERGLPIQVIAALNGARILRTHEVKKLYDLLQTIS